MIKSIGVMLGILILSLSFPLLAYTDDPATLKKSQIKTYLSYDPVPWPDHFETSKHSFVKPGVKYGISDNFEWNSCFTFYELGVIEYLVSLKYKLPYSGQRWIHSLNLTWNHMFNKSIEDLSKDYGWAGPFHEPSEKSYYRSWNSHLQYHIGYKINERLTISLNLGIQYWKLVDINHDTGWSRNYGFAPAMSFPGLHYKVNDKINISIHYGDGDTGDIGLIGIGYLLK